MSKLSEKLKEIYKEYEIKYGVRNLYEFSNILGIPFKALNSYLYEDVTPRKVRRRELAEKLGCDYEDLFGEEEDKITEFSKRIDLLTNKYWLSNKDIAQFSNIGYKNFGNMKSGDRRLNANVCYTIAKTFNVSIGWLVGKEPADKYDMNPIFEKLDQDTKKQILELILCLLEKEDVNNEHIQSKNE